MKTLLFITAVIFYSTAFGQGNEKIAIKKGTFNIGGKTSIGFSNHKDDDATYETDMFNVEILPNFGYTIKKNLVIGLGVGYGYTESDSFEINNSDFENRNSRTNRFYIFPYLKKFIPMGQKLAMYVQGECRFSEGKSENTTSVNRVNSNNSTSRTFFAGFRPGVAYFLSQGFVLEANLGTLGYTLVKNKYNSRGENNGYNKANYFSFSLDSSQLQFGVSYFF